MSWVWMGACDRENIWQRKVHRALRMDTGKTAVKVIPWSRHRVLRKGCMQWSGVFCRTDQHKWALSKHPYSSYISVLVIDHRLWWCWVSSLLKSLWKGRKWMSHIVNLSILIFPMQVSCSWTERLAALWTNIWRVCMLRVTSDRAYTYVILWVGLQRVNWKHTGLYLPQKNKCVISTCFGTCLYQ